ncbi:MAG: hypothetical protein ACYS0K_08000 [Planctomycetota bacterium]|jgi:hypothetical protein
MHRAALFILVVLASTASAKPVTVQYDRAFDNAWLAAEVEVVAVEIGAWMAWGGQRGRVRVKVTSDPSRIYRGWKHVGRTVELRPADFAAQTCTASLKRHEGSLSKVLLVVDAQRVITLGGPAEGDGYLLRGWCDNNDCQLRAAAGFGGEVVKRQRADRLSIARATLLDRYRTPRREFWARVTRFLDGERPALNRADLMRWITELAAKEPARRRRAHEFLAARGPLHIGTLREAADGSDDPEVRRRITRILSGMQAHVEAHEVATRLGGSPLAARIFVARDGVEVLTGSALSRARAYLRALEAYAAEDDR